MPEFVVLFTTTTSTAIRVEADTPEQAEAVAADELPGSLCHQCSRERDQGDWELHSVEDKDGTVVLTGPDYPGDGG